MQTKSNIQLIVERMRVIENFEDNIKSLQEKYCIENSIFTMSGNDLMEVVKGYFVIESEHSDLHEAFKTLRKTGNAVRVMGEEYQVGHIYKTLGECPKDSQIYDITSGKII